MEKVKEYLEKIIRKSKDPQAYYNYVIEHRKSTKKPYHSVTIMWTKQGVAPTQMTFESQKELVDALKRYYRTRKDDDLKIKFHLNQIEASKNVIKYHEKLLNVYKSEKK